ncbi:hypothetical protein Pst134EB_014637 [Puccinia striiformis f. sp. tritici]|uniref:Blue (type 1) copper domain-containing protein n=1 Tax=Puccinia striiformis f. sp. tritici PST-78 TaxID=1165861 RepID=A0A0L0VSZ5_9BASI|nr:hypothetical protein Pst134EB_014637 [Puccinia striiformis f. sp. tritici]KNF02125.1 hypothetical protein PSTG_04625 [Puccinia striiformis f. sp. tritici PST-78]KNF02126.1 hypothetical protein, variant [Puccinia striiformis f. sp. tritici PST-78]
MAKLLHFFFVLVIWASIVSPLSSQGQPGADPTKPNPPNQKPPETPVRQGINHVIKVGDDNAAKTFTPPTIRAKVGDLVTFEFHPKAHNVSQSTFDNPCVVPQGPEGTGFVSDLQVVSKTTDLSHRPRWTLQILSDTPIWFHCAPHCGVGMVGAINPPTSGEQTFEKFVEKAKVAGSAAKKLQVGAKPGEPGGKPSEPGAIPAEKTAARISDKKVDPAGGKGAEEGASATLQRGQPKTANDVAAMSQNTASLDANSTLAAKGKDPFSDAYSMKLMRQRKVALASVSFSLLVPGLLNTIY